MDVGSRELFGMFVAKNHEATPGKLCASTVFRNSCGWYVYLVVCLQHVSWICYIYILCFFFVNWYQQDSSNQSFGMVHQCSLAPWLETSTSYHPSKLNGTESQRTPWPVSCDRAIGYSGFFGVSETWVRPLEISWIPTMNRLRYLFFFFFYHHRLGNILCFFWR